DIIHTIISRSVRAVGAEQGVITLVDAQADNSMKTLVRTMTSSSPHQQYHFNQSLLGWMHLNKKPLLVNDPAHDERFRGVVWDTTIRSLLAVPMMVKSVLTGVLTVYNKKADGGFTDADQRLLAIIAGQSAQVVENARLAESERALQRIREELRLASRIQADLLPKDPPVVPGYDIAGRSIPAQVVGGDLFDFIPMEGGRIALCLGDVSGKGLPASLLMANVQATLRGQTLLDTRVGLCVGRANRLLYQSTSPEKFVTLFYGVLDPARHTLAYTDAGHNAPFHLGPGDVIQRLSIGGMILGIMDDVAFEEGSLTFAPGDMLFVYSDGISEAMNKEEEQFGEERLADLLCAHRQESAAGITDAVLEAVRQFAQGIPQADDMTVVVVKRLAAG
ncbi:MAG TPA: GAF domain-containing SpoIIE family protein phosphatase, partial [Bacteroidota bacterium]